MYTYCLIVIETFLGCNITSNLWMDPIITPGELMCYLCLGACCVALRWIIVSTQVWFLYLIPSPFLDELSFPAFFLAKPSALTFPHTMSPNGMLGHNTLIYDPSVVRVIYLINPIQRVDSCLRRDSPHVFLAKPSALMFTVTLSPKVRRRKNPIFNILSTLSNVEFISNNKL